MSCVVEVVDSVNANGQSVEENPSANQVEQVVTHILVHRNPVQERERERERDESGQLRERDESRQLNMHGHVYYS